MSSPIHILARNMRASATAPSEDGENVYCLEEAGGSLVQELWVNNEPGIRTFITEGVKEHTPALYLVNEKNRYVFFLDNTNHLKCVAYNEDDEEWEDAPFNKKLSEIEIHADTHLSGFSNAWGMMVIFETKSGQLATLVGYDGQWEVTGTVSAGVQVNQGTAHAAMDGQDKLHLFCFGNDDQIHHVFQRHDKPDWETAVIENSKLEVPPVRIVAFPKEDELSFDVYVLLVNSQLIRIEAGGTRAELGTIRGEKLIPPTAAECFVLTPLLVGFSHLLGNPCARGGNIQFMNTGIINSGTMNMYQLPSYASNQPQPQRPTWAAAGSF